MPIQPPSSPPEYPRKRESVKEASLSDVGSLLNNPESESRLFIFYVRQGLSLTIASLVQYLHC